MTNWTILYIDKVIEVDLPLISSAERKRILKTIDKKLATNPIAFGKPLRYSLAGHRSLRVGDYRALFIIQAEQKTVTITHIDHRKDVYE